MQAQPELRIVWAGNLCNAYVLQRSKLEITLRPTMYCRLLLDADTWLQSVATCSTTPNSLIRP